MINKNELYMLHRLLEGANHHYQAEMASGLQSDQAIKSGDMLLMRNNLIEGEIVTMEDGQQFISVVRGITPAGLEELVSLLVRATH